MDMEELKTLKVCAAETEEMGVVVQVEPSV